MEQSKACHTFHSGHTHHAHIKKTLSFISISVPDAEIPRYSTVKDMHITSDDHMPLFYGMCGQKYRDTQFPLCGCKIPPSVFFRGMMEWSTISRGHLAALHVSPPSTTYRCDPVDDRITDDARDIKNALRTYLVFCLSLSLPFVFFSIFICS